MVRPQYGTQIISQSQPSDIEQLSVKNEQTKYQILPVVDGTEKATDKCSNSESLKMVHIKPKICDSEKLKQLLEKEQDMEIQDLSSSSEPEEIILDDSGETSDKGSFLTEIKSKPVNKQTNLDEITLLDVFNHSLMRKSILIMFVNWVVVTLGNFLFHFGIKEYVVDTRNN